MAAAMLVAGAAWGSAVDGLAVSAARELRTMVHRALTRGIGARRAVGADLAFHGPPRRLGPAEAAVTEAVALWARWVPAWPGPVAKLADAWAAEWELPAA